MQQTENQRLKILMSVLNIKTQKEFAHALKIKEGSLSDVLRGKDGLKVSNSIKDKLENLFNVNISWLETGEGEMFKPSIAAEPEVEYQVKQIKAASVPIYDVQFSAGVMASLIESRENHYPVGYLSIPEVNGCDAIIKAKGDSMADRINDGDWIGIKRIDNWKEWLPMNYIYAIITDQMELVKYLKKGNTEDTFKIVSHNKFYDEDEIPKSMIREIWSVKAVLPFSKIETLI